MARSLAIGQHDFKGRIEMAKESRNGASGFRARVGKTRVRKTIRFWQKRSPNRDSMGLRPYPLPN
jgi:hypothetical protein